MGQQHMDNSSTHQDALLAIARAIHNGGGFDEWNMRFHDPVQREAYRLAATELGDDLCRAHSLPTWAAIAEAEHRSAQEGHPAPALGANSLPEPWTKTTGEAL